MIAMTLAAGLTRFLTCRKFAARLSRWISAHVGRPEMLICSSWNDGMRCSLPGDPIFVARNKISLVVQLIITQVKGGIVGYDEGRVRIQGAFWMGRARRTRKEQRRVCSRGSPSCRTG